METFVEHYKGGHIPGHPDATLHLISYYKESSQLDRGIQFWNWAVCRDEQYVNIGTYGAAIELLTVYGKSLSYCEEVYLHALKRFPTDFNEYHLSPSAILPRQHKPSLLKGTSLLLLQGIMQARLSHGDWRNAYLALDTALRLHPTQIPPRFLQAFEYERPFCEFFNVFCLIGQGGNQIRAPALTKMFGKIAAVHKMDKRGSRDFEYLTALLTALHSTIATNETLSEITLNSLLRIILEATSYNPSFPKDEQIILDLVKPILLIFARLDVLPSFSTFSMIFKAAASSKRPGLMRWAFEELKIRQLQYTTLDMRKILLKVGQKSDVETTKLAWVILSQTLRDSGGIEILVWKTLAEVMRQAGDIGFLHDQLRLHSVSNFKVPHGLDKEDRGIQSTESLEDKSELKETSDLTKTEDLPFLAEQEVVSLDWQHNFSNFLENVRRYLRITSLGLHRNLKKYPPTYDSMWAWTDNVDETWQRKLYDQLNQDPYLQPSKVPSTEKKLPKDGQIDTVNQHDTRKQRDRDYTHMLRSSVHDEPVIGPTGFTFDELRYRSWKAINSLLIQAEMFESKVEKSVDEAIEQGTRPDLARSSHKTRGWRYYEITQLHLEIHLQAIQERKARTITEEEWRTKILALRGLATFKPTLSN